MIIACPEDGWIVEATRAEISQRTFTSGTALQERMDNLVSRPVLRIKTRDGGSREWWIPDNCDAKNIIAGFVSMIGQGRKVMILPKGWQKPEEDDL